MPVAPEGARLWVQVPKDWRRPHTPGAYTVSWDDARDYGQVTPRPAPEDIPSFYDLGSYFTHEESGFDENPTRLRDRALVHLAWRTDRGKEAEEEWNELLGRQRRRVLEIGCGQGWILGPLRDQGHEVTGVEPDPAARAKAQAEGLEVFDGTAESIPSELSGRRFDLIIFHHVLEHCLDPSLAVRNARALLAEDGVLVAETPNNACRGAAWFGPCWCWLDIPRHLNFFTDRSLVTLLKESGFEVSKVEYCGYVRQFLPGWIEEQDRIAAAFQRRRLRGVGRYWGYLLDTFWRPSREKYDSVRVVARPAP